MRYGPCLLIGILFLACSPSPRQESLSDTVQPTPNQAVVIPEEAIWADSAILRYLRGNRERLTEVDGIPVTYMKDRTERDGRTYAAVKIGHSFEGHYTADQWIYVDSQTQAIYEYDLGNDILLPWPTPPAADEIPPSGTYTYDIAFAEWNGHTLDYKALVYIQGDSVEVYLLHGKLTGVPPRGGLAGGRLRKRRSGVWIISSDPADVNAEEVGGCTDGPPVIDLKKKVFWMC